MSVIEGVLRFHVSVQCQFVEDVGEAMRDLENEAAVRLPSVVRDVTVDGGCRQVPWLAAVQRLNEEIVRFILLVTWFWRVPQKEDSITYFANPGWLCR